MVTGADKSGYYNFVEVVFMKEKKDMEWMIVKYNVVIIYYNFSHTIVIIKVNFVSRIEVKVTGLS